VRHELNKTSGSYGKMKTEEIKVGVKAEWDKANTILVQQPDEELYYGSLYPEGALNQGPFNRRKAVKEHRLFADTLQKNGARVLSLSDILLDGAYDSESEEPVEGDALEGLRELARKSLDYKFNNLNMADNVEILKTYEYVICTTDPRDLLSLILTRPSFAIGYCNEGNSRFRHTATVNPLYAQIFLRDSMITTDKGIVMGNMNSSQRRREIEIAEFSLGKLGIKPLYEVKNPGKLEGGDYLPAGDLAFIGQGKRTNAEGIRQLLENMVFGFPMIAVVKDPTPSQDEMHLDTYFNLYDERQALVLNERIDPKLAFHGKIPKVDVYELSNGRYILTEKDIDFPDFLKNIHFKTTPVDKDIQLHYGLNFLCVAPSNIVGVDIEAKARMAEHFKALKDELGSIKGAYYDRELLLRLGRSYGSLLQYNSKIQGIDLLAFNHLNMAYGGPHCLTQVISRG